MSNNDEKLVLGVVLEALGEGLGAIFAPRTTPWASLGLPWAPPGLSLDPSGAPQGSLWTPSASQVNFWTQKVGSLAAQSDQNTVNSSKN